jgi:serine/threonine protein kinase
LPPAPDSVPTKSCRCSKSAGWAKSILTADPDRLARFEREARVLASLNHPNIATLFAVEEGAAGYALVMELVDGETLADLLRDKPLSLKEALSLTRN